MQSTRQSQGAKYCACHLWETTREEAVIERENRMVVARDCGLVEMGNCYLMSIELPFCKKRRVLEMDGDNGCTII